MTPNNFWDRINALIKAQNTTQEAICNKTEIKLATLRGWVTHSRFPPADHCYKIATALNMSVEYLVTGSKGDTVSKISSSLDETINQLKAIQSDLNALH